MIRRAAGLLFVFAVGCLDDWGLEERGFPCREPADCIEGFVCSPARFVCVPEDEATTSPDARDGDDADGDDAGTTDGGASGDPLDAGQPDVDPLDAGPPDAEVPDTGA